MNKELKKQLVLNLPFLILGLVATNFGEAWRISEGVEVSEKLQGLLIGGGLKKAFISPLPSIYPADLLIGTVCAGVLRLVAFFKGKDAKRFRHGEEYGSARWGAYYQL